MLQKPVAKKKGIKMGNITVWARLNDGAGKRESEQDQDSPHNLEGARICADRKAGKRQRRAPQEIGMDPSREGREASSARHLSLI